MPYIVFAGSFPRQEEVRIAKASGAKVLCFASNDSIAERMIDYGADALILEGSEAGGHIGHVSTIVLIQQVLFHYPQLPVFVAGGIATGKMIAHLLLMGAAGVQMGTIFAMAEESPAHPKFKERFRKARAREAFATPQYSSALPVVAVRALKNKGSEEFGRLQLELIQKLERGEIQPHPGPVRGGKILGRRPAPRRPGRRRGVRLADGRPERRADPRHQAGEGYRQRTWSRRLKRRFTSLGLIELR